MQGTFEDDLKRISAQGPVREHVSIPGGFHQDLFKRVSRKISRGVQDHTLRHQTACHYHRPRISQGLAKDRKQESSCQDLYKRSAQDYHRKTCRCSSRSCKILRQEPPQCLAQELSFKQDSGQAQRPEQPFCMSMHNRHARGRAILILKGNATDRDQVRLVWQASRQLGQSKRTVTKSYKITRAI